MGTPAGRGSWPCNGVTTPSSSRPLNPCQAVVAEIVHLLLSLGGGSPQGGPRTAPPLDGSTPSSLWGGHRDGRESAFLCLLGCCHGEPRKPGSSLAFGSVGPQRQGSLCGARGANSAEWDAVGLEAQVRRWALEAKRGGSSFHAFAPGPRSSYYWGHCLCHGHWLKTQSMLEGQWFKMCVKCLSFLFYLTCCFIEMKFT